MMSVSFPEEEACDMCRGKQIKDIAWFMIVMSVLLFFIGAGTHLNLLLSRISWAHRPLSSALSHEQDAAKISALAGTLARQTLQ